MIVAALIILVNIITEVVKSFLELKNAKTINNFVTVLSVVLTVCVFLAYWQINQMQIAWYLILTFIIIGFAVAYGAMFGYDKLLSYFKDLRDK